MIRYTKDERGHRRFEAGGRTFRAFWMQLGHRWIVSELQLDGSALKVAERRNWPDVERFIYRCYGENLPTLSQS